MCCCVTHELQLCIIVLLTSCSCVLLFYSRVTVVYYCFTHELQSCVVVLLTRCSRVLLFYSRSAVVYCCFTHELQLCIIVLLTSYSRILLFYSRGAVVCCCVTHELQLCVVGRTLADHHVIDTAENRIVVVDVCDLHMHCACGLKKVVHHGIMKASLHNCWAPDTLRLSTTPPPLPTHSYILVSWA